MRIHKKLIAAIFDRSRCRKGIASLLVAASFLALPIGILANELSNSTWSIPTEQISLALGTAMMDDLAARLAAATSRLGEAVQEIERRFNEPHLRSARFAKIDGDAQVPLTSTG